MYRQSWRPLVTSSQDLLVLVVFFAKKQNLWSWDHPPQVQNYQDFCIIGCQIKLILLYIMCNLWNVSVILQCYNNLQDLRLSPSGENQNCVDEEIHHEPFQDLALNHNIFKLLDLLKSLDFILLEDPHVHIRRLPPRRAA
jgi:hypothetical protein